MPEYYAKHAVMLIDSVVKYDIFICSIILSKLSFAIKTVSAKLALITVKKLHRLEQ